MSAEGQMGKRKVSNSYQSDLKRKSIHIHVCFHMFIHYHTKCSHFKIHLNASFLHCFVIWS